MLSGRSLWNGVALLITAAVVSGCASFHPRPLGRESLSASAPVEQRGHLKVRARLLSRPEIQQHFDTKLWQKRIQPVWIEIENGTDHPLWLMRVGVDRDYYPTSEVSYRSHRFGATKTNRRIDDYFRANELPVVQPPGSRRSGFVHTEYVRDAKSFNVELLGNGTLQLFHFAQETPGFEADFNVRHLDRMIADTEYQDLRLDQLREELELLPCCATDEDGKRQGDPLNLVLVGEFKTVLQALVRSGWRLTEPESSTAYWRIFKAFLLGKQYQNAPVSHLYAFGRSQDLAFQKPRHTIKQRNHMRLWLTPCRQEGVPVWLGQISRDTGVRFTPHTWHLSTHKIAPDVDEARSYLVADLLLSQVLDTIGWVKGVGAVEPQSSRKNLTGDPYHTDGLRVVLVLSEDLVDVESIQRLDWEVPPQPPLDVNALNELEKP